VDFKAARIPLVDERGHRVDFNALRHEESFAVTAVHKNVRSENEVEMSNV